jgi:hypothetical protein
MGMMATVRQAGFTEIEDWDMFFSFWGGDWGATTIMLDEGEGRYRYGEGSKGAAAALGGCQKRVWRDWIE